MRSIRGSCLLSRIRSIRPRSPAPLTVTSDPYLLPFPLTLTSYPYVLPLPLTLTSYPYLLPLPLTLTSYPHLLPSSLPSEHRPSVAGTCPSIFDIKTNVILLDSSKTPVNISANVAQIHLEAL